MVSIVQNLQWGFVLISHVCIALDGYKSTHLKKYLISVNIPIYLLNHMKENVLNKSKYLLALGLVTIYCRIMCLHNIVLVNSQCFGILPIDKGFYICSDDISSIAPMLQILLPSFPDSVTGEILLIQPYQWHSRDIPFQLTFSVKNSVILYGMLTCSP